MKSCLYIRELQRTRREAIDNLSETGETFRDAGIQLEDDQVPLTLGEKVGQAAQAGWQKGSEAAGRTYGKALGGLEENISRVGRSVSRGAEATVAGVSAAVGKASEKARQTSAAVVQTLESFNRDRIAAAEAVRKSLSTGRDRLGALAASTGKAINEAVGAGRQKFDELRNSAASGAKASAEGAALVASGVVTGATEGLKKSLQKGAETLDLWKKSAVQLGKSIVGEVGARATSAKEALGSQVEPYRLAARERIKNFSESMRQAGEEAKRLTDETTLSLRNWATEKGNDARERANSVRQRAATEVSMAVEKGKLFLAPLWEEVQSEREGMKANNEMLHHKAGLVIESVSEAAQPLLDRILDSGRDLRDGMVGFTRQQLEGVQAFGRTIAGRALEAAGPALGNLAERWESLRLRSNESRDRLNSFLTETVGGSANLFRKLKENAGSRAKRVGELLSGATAIGGKVITGGKELPLELVGKFKERAAAAREWLDEQKDKITAGRSALGRYFQVYAVERWENAKIPDLELKRRLKLLGAVGAASARRGAVIGTATALEGARLANEAVRDPRGRLLLGAIAMTLFLATHPGAVTQMTSFLQDSADKLGNLDLSHLFGNFHSAPDASAHMPVGGDVLTPDQAVNHGLGTIDGVAPVDHFGSVPAAGHIPQPDHIPAPDFQGAPQATPTETPVFPPTGGVLVSPSGVELGPIRNDLLSRLIPGQPIAQQVQVLAQGLPGGTDANFGSLMRQALNVNIGNFSSTAQAVVNNSQNYTADVVATARDQLNAIAQLQAQPNIDPRSKVGMDLLFRAMHYWRP